MILVTGASGLLGSTVLRSALECGRKAFGICHTHHTTVPHVATTRLDLTDFESTENVISRMRPSSIIHCAAATNVDWCEENPEQAQRINLDAAEFLAGIAREISASFIHISTDSIFDGRCGNYSEADTPTPLNSYARSKLLAEEVVLRVHPCPLVVRVNFYGWRAQNKPSLAQWVVDELRGGRDVPGFTDVFFCPMLANDLAEILFVMLDRRLSGIYNVVGSERISKYEFANRLAMLFGFDSARVIPCSVANARLRAPRPHDTSLNTDKISKVLGCALPNVESGLQKFKSLSDAEHLHPSSSGFAGVNK